MDKVSSPNSLFSQASQQQDKTKKKDSAKVAVACATESPNKQATNSVFAATDEFGNFTIHLPSRLHATPNLENACVVNVLQLLPDSACSLRHRPAASYRLRPSSAAAADGVRGYTAGVIRLQHRGTPSGKCVQAYENNG
uniref:Uncharacterized protein n=1 Tax=Leersia perrieri TaxID=77586 RepID=A0A0D9XII1_9ORYZ